MKRSVPARKALLATVTVIVCGLVLVLVGLPSYETPHKRRADRPAPGARVEAQPHLPRVAFPAEPDAVAITLRTEHDEPIASARVASIEITATEPAPVSAVTDERGTCLLRPLRPGRHLVQVRHPSHPPTRVTLDVTAQSRSFVIRLESGHVLTGRVLSIRGRPVPDAIVDLYPLTRSEPAPTSAPDGRRSTGTDAGGEFAFRDVVDADYQIAVRAPGYLMGSHHPRSVRPSSRLLTLRLHPVMATGLAWIDPVTRSQLSLPVGTLVRISAERTPLQSIQPRPGPEPLPLDLDTIARLEKQELFLALTDEIALDWDDATLAATLDLSVPGFGDLRQPCVLRRFTAAPPLCEFALPVPTTWVHCQLRITARVDPGLCPGTPPSLVLSLHGSRTGHEASFVCHPNDAVETYLPPDRFEVMVSIDTHCRRRLADVEVTSEGENAFVRDLPVETCFTVAVVDAVLGTALDAWIVRRLDATNEGLPCARWHDVLVRDARALLFVNLPAGSYELEVEAAGHVAGRRIEVRRGVPAQIRIPL